MESSRHFILGTAGHIDHGKTALVKALTGVDTDRLKEEKARGLTIDLGFAHFGDNATIIDVPGHERFIKNMVAGVSTIDLVLFVIAADDGIMPQTREHLDILKILQVQNGIIVITKKDMVEADWLEMVKEDVRELVHDTALANAEIMAVSAIENDGIDALRDKIIACFESLPPRHNRGVFWLPVDRSFVMKGFGTVVTGSVLSGQIQTGDFVDILPHGEKVRVRGIQKHNAEASLAKIGDRAAINLHALLAVTLHVAMCWPRPAISKQPGACTPNYTCLRMRFPSKPTCGCVCISARLRLWRVSSRSGAQKSKRVKAAMCNSISKSRQPRAVSIRL